MTKKKKKGKFVTFAISLIVICFGFVMWTQINSSKAEYRSLQQQEIKLEAQYQEEVKEQESLEERKVYVQTKKYVEEVAKQIGYVYPDEIIYKPKN